MARLATAQLSRAVQGWHQNELTDTRLQAEEARREAYAARCCCFLHLKTAISLNHLFFDHRGAKHRICGS